MGRFIRHTRCNNCGSSDANGVYENGSAYCYSCNKYSKPNSEGAVDTEIQAEENTKQAAFLEGEAQALANRGLTQATCEFWGYQIGDSFGEPCHIANYRNAKGQLVAQKIRKANKKFSVVGNGRDMPLYGQWLWSGGRSIVITEGELDALSVSQAFGNKYAVVSLPSGAQSAVKVVQQHYEYLNGFEKIVLCFDNDEPGQKATEEVAALLPPGKAFVMQLPCKDANDTLKEKGAEAITKAYWNAKEWRPDGIRKAEELREAVLNPVKREAIPYPYSGLNDKVKGLRQGELVTITSGSGLGKSTFLRELMYDLLFNHNQRVGAMFLEETNEETIEYLMGIHLNKNIVFTPEDVSQQDRVASFNAVAAKPLYLWDHFGSQDIEVVLNKIRYMAKALEVKWVLLDHLSILVSGIETFDERKTIDIAMTKLRSLVQETGIGMVLVSHLKRPSGDKGHEDGAEVHLGQLRGSHSIAQLSDFVIGLQKNPDDPHGEGLEAVVLKARKGGRRGSAGMLDYNIETGRLTESGF
jgi:twinkle protein